MAATFSYDATDLETDLNWIRFRVGDTDENDPQIYDEEINSLIAMLDDRVLVAHVVAKAIAAKYRRYGSVKEAEAFDELATQIAGEITGTSASYL